MILPLNKVKIGRKEYDVKSGDYILYNGTIYQFCTGDKRILKQQGFDTFNSLQLPTTMVKKIPFIRMVKVNFQRNGLDMTKWYF
jgi:hypothetical protein